MAKTIQEIVQEQVASKIASGEELEAATSRVSEVTAQLREAEAEAAKARRAALKSGWSETELRSLGLSGSARSKRRSSKDLHRAPDDAELDQANSDAPAYSAVDQS